MSNVYYSWEIINDHEVVKNCDKSFFDHHGSGLPPQLRNFFEVGSLGLGERKNLILNINNCDYNAYIVRESDKVRGPKNQLMGRTRIEWYSDLSSVFREIPHREYPRCRFTKVSPNKYSLSFCDISTEKFNEENESDIYVSNDIEGKKIIHYSTKYERSPKNRAAAIKIHGTKCMICGFDFEEHYGELGKDYIEVHHIKPLYDLQEEVKIDPEKDLICVCANCHRMIHRKRNEIVSYEDMIKLVEEYTKGKKS